MSMNSTSRREFLEVAGGTLGAAWVAAHWPRISAAAAHAHAAATSPVDHTFRLFTPAQARDVAAIAAQIVPSGATPGAREAGVVYFIDHILAGLYAARSGSFLAQLAAFQDEFAKHDAGGRQIADLPEPAQIEYLRSVEATPFFGAMRFLTVLGLLSLPSYGGNEAKVGWELVGFVDQHVWQPPFGEYDRDYPGFVPYEQEPQS
jgi:hypothetical protein